MFQYFHVCNHQEKSVKPEGERHIIPIRSKGQIDLLVKGATILAIEEVRAITYTERTDKKYFEYDKTMDPQHYDDAVIERGYYDNASDYYVNYSKHFKDGHPKSEPLPKHYYQAYLHNRINWNVEAPLTYEVTAIVRFQEDYKRVYEVGDCPICQGRGWFVDVLNANGRFHKDKGIDLIVQKVIKDMMTELYSSVINLEYGTVLKQTVGGVVKEDEEIFDDIRIIVSDVEDKYLLRQQTTYNSLELDERLVSLTVGKIFRLPKDVRRIAMDLVIQTEYESRNFRFAL